MKKLNPTRKCLGVFWVLKNGAIKMKQVTRVKINKKYSKSCMENE